MAASFVFPKTVNYVNIIKNKGGVTYGIFHENKRLYYQ